MDLDLEPLGPSHRERLWRWRREPGFERTFSGWGWSCGGELDTWLAERTRPGRHYAFVVVDTQARMNRELALTTVSHWPTTRLAEISFAVASVHRRAGVATRAVQGTMSWATSQLEVDAFEAWTDATNHASQRFLARLGFARLQDRRPVSWRLARDG